MRGERHSPLNSRRGVTEMPGRQKLYFLNVALFPVEVLHFPNKLLDWEALRRFLLPTHPLIPAPLNWQDCENLPHPFSLEFRISFLFWRWVDVNNQMS
jgi:hypothetical protein